MNGMRCRLLFSCPRLNDVLSAILPAELGTADIVQTENLLRGIPLAVIQRIFRLIKKVRVRFAQRIRYGDRHGNRAFFRMFRFTSNLCRHFSVPRFKADQQAVVFVYAARDHSRIANDIIRDRFRFTCRGIVKSCRPLTCKSNFQILEAGHISVARNRTARNEEPSVAVILAKLIQKIVRQNARIGTNIHQTDTIQRAENRTACERNSFGGFGKHRTAFARDRIFQRGQFAYKDHSAARLTEGFESGKRGGAQGLTAGNDDHVVRHFSHAEGCALLLAKRGNERFGNEIKINASEEEPFRQVLEIVIHIFSRAKRVRVRTPMQPIAFNRMDHANLDHRFTARHCRIDAGEMILDERIFLPPRGLIVNGSGIVALGFSRHGYERKVRHAYRYAERRHPVTVHFMLPEIEVPVGNAVHFAKNALSAELVRGGLRLLDRRVFKIALQHIHAGHTEASVKTHCLTDGVGLCAQRGLSHDVSRQLDAMLVAPFAAVIRKSGGKAFANVVMIMVTDHGSHTVGAFPDQFGNICDQIFLAVNGSEGFGKIIRPGESGRALLRCVFQRVFGHELRFVREDGMNRFVEFITDGVQIAFVGDLNETVDCRFVERIHVSLPVVPSTVLGYLHISIPFLMLGGFVFTDYFPIDQLARGIQLHVEASEQSALFGKFRSAFRISIRNAADFCVRLVGKEQMARTEALFFGDKAARRAGGPTVLIVKPCDHVLAFRFFHAIFDECHEFFAEIRRCHTRSDVHMRTAEAHFFENLELSVQFLLIQLAVPCPEGSAAVFRRWFGKERVIQTGSAVFLI